MPELPEVETIVKYLRQHICGERVLGLQILSRRAIRDHKNPAEIKKLVLGKCIQDIFRAGKYIIFQLSSGYSLATHLMMTGSFLLNPSDKKVHDRVVFRLSHKKTLVFRDIRQFGRLRVIKPPLKLVGQDPLFISFGEFCNIFGLRTAGIKNLLLNQKLLAGIGNIYADEILWYAGISPQRKTSSLGKHELKKLYRSIKYVLGLAIRKEGTSSRNYRKPDGSEGGYYKIRRAYQRTGSKCLKNDGGIIKRIVLDQRSTHFCPQHQK